MSDSILLRSWPVGSPGSISPPVSSSTTPLIEAINASDPMPVFAILTALDLVYLFSSCASTGWVRLLASARSASRSSVPWQSRPSLERYAAIPLTFPPADRIRLGSSSHVSTPQAAVAFTTTSAAILKMSWTPQRYLILPALNSLPTKSDQLMFPGPL
jgi:hypothetical protein